MSFKNKWKKVRKWIADVLSLLYIRISLFHVISSYTEKRFSHAIETLCQVLVHLSIYFIQHRFCFDAFTSRNAAKDQITCLQRFF